MRSMQEDKRLGLILRPAGIGWQRTHCQNPFAQILGERRARIHFATRDEQNRSRGAWAEFSFDQEIPTLLRASERPSIDLGLLGAFDDAGAMPGSIVEFEGRLLLFYTGWTLGRTVPFHFHIGMAISPDRGETFEKVSPAPVLGRNRHDPYICGAPWVIAENGALRMWYSSATSWDADGGSDPLHHYTIKHATSGDGVEWETSDHICIPYREGEHAIARPVVMKDGQDYRMIYCARRMGESYRVFEARSRDGLVWERSAEVFLDVGAAAWENEMVCYASELQVGESRLVLYNGNSYGRDGFGAAYMARE